eukprot:1139518-Pelagomonas_calceolata.AAC.5
MRSGGWLRLVQMCCPTLRWRRFIRFKSKASLTLLTTCLQQTPCEIHIWSSKRVIATYTVEHAGTSTVESCMSLSCIAACYHA